MNEQHEPAQNRPGRTEPLAADTAAAALDDAAIGALVRDAAERWVVPPQRLGRPTWRDFVERRSSRGFGPGSGWGRRLTGAAGTALVATVVLALVAVWLSAPRSSSPVVGPGALPTSSGPGASPSAEDSTIPSSGPSSGPGTPAPGGSALASAPPSTAPNPTPSPSATTPAPAGTPLPEHLIVGPPLSEPSVLVGADSGYRMLSLATGQLGPIVADRSSGLTRIWRLADGSYLCACMTRTTAVDLNGGTEGVSMAVRRLDGDGNLTGTVKGPTYETRSSAKAVSDSVPTVDVTVGLSADHRWFYVGSSVLVAGIWIVSVDVVDATDGRIIEAIPVDSVPGDVGAGSTRFAVAPRIIVAADGGHVAVVTVTVTDPNGPVSTSRTINTVSSEGTLFGGQLLPPLRHLGLAGNDCAGAVEGFASATSYYVLCAEGTTTLDRFGLDGTLIGTTEVDVSNASYPAEPVVDPVNSTLYAWDPFKLRLTAIDLRTGLVSGSLAAPAATAVSSDAFGGLARAIGRWLAPSAAAKIALTPGLVLSADGKRLYALGLTGRGVEDAGGSSGVFVFDTPAGIGDGNPGAPLAFVGQWPPTADFFSLGLSSDGSLLYAAGTAGVDAAGATTGQAASVTVFDTATGEVRAIFGQVPMTVDFQREGRP